MSKLDRFYVPEWKGCVYIRHLSGLERAEFDKINPTENSPILWLVCRTVTNKNGERLFSDEQLEDIGNKSYSAILRIANRAAEVNATSKRSIDSLMAELQQYPSERFYMRLAGHLGYADVDGMLAGMSSRQVSKWMAQFKLEPWGTHEEDRRTATIAATIANAAPGKKRKAWRPDDFMPRRESANQDWQQQRQMLRALTGR